MTQILKIIFKTKLNIGFLGEINIVIKRSLRIYKNKKEKGKRLKYIKSILLNGTFPNISFSD